MDTQNNLFLINTEDSAVLVPTQERAEQYVKDMMCGMLERGVPVSIKIQQRSQGEVEAFLFGKPITASTQNPEPTGKLPPSGKLPPAAKIKKAAPAKKATAKVAKTAKAPAGRTGVTGAVLDAINGGADNAKKIAKIVGKATNTVDFHVNKLISQGLVTKSGTTAGVTILPLKRPTPAGKEINCNARGRMILAVDCVYNDASPVCRSCVVRPKN